MTKDDTWQPNDVKVLEHKRKGVKPTRGITYPYTVYLIQHKKTKKYRVCEFYYGASGPVNKLTTDDYLEALKDYTNYGD